ncbi:hypothetical protein ACWCYZ_45415, partial [Streptomyces virginiae]
MHHHGPAFRADAVLDPPLDLGHGPVLGLGQALLAAGLGDQRADFDEEGVDLLLNHPEPGQIRWEESARITHRRPEVPATDPPGVAVVRAVPIPPTRCPETQERPVGDPTERACVRMRAWVGPAGGLVPVVGGPEVPGADRAAVA